MPQLNVGTIRGNSPNFRVELDANSTLEMASELRINAQSYIPMPTGTTAQRPSPPEPGSTRYNTTISRLETWTGSNWIQI